MRSFTTSPMPKAAALAFAALLVAACHRGADRPDLVQGSNIPAGFDVTLLADKDTQFDLDGAPLTSEDLKSAFRYRQEEKLPMSTVLLKRGEKQKVKKEHLASLVGLAHQMGFKAYVDEDGVISELQASGTLKEQLNKDEADSGSRDGKQ